MVFMMLHTYSQIEISIETFLLSMTSEIESFKGYWYTPLDENEQKWERKTPMETTIGSKKTIFNSVYKVF